MPHSFKAFHVSFILYILHIQLNHNDNGASTWSRHWDVYLTVYLCQCLHSLCSSGPGWVWGEDLPPEALPGDTGGRTEPDHRVPPVLRPALRAKPQSPPLLPGTLSGASFVPESPWNESRWIERMIRSLYCLYLQYQLFNSVSLETLCVSLCLECEGSSKADTTWHWTLLCDVLLMYVNWCCHFTP